jgi:hypothetical protein
MVRWITNAPALVFVKHVNCFIVVNVFAEMLEWTTQLGEAAIIMGQIDEISNKHETRLGAERLLDVHLSPEGLAEDLFADAAYRAHLAEVLARRAIALATGPVAGP